MSTQKVEIEIKNNLAKPKAREQEFRALPEALELRAAEAEAGMPTLVVSFPLNEWAEIRSAREGHFMERMAPTAFDKTIAENAERMRVLFQHGKDPSVGEKPLGPIRSLASDGERVTGEVPLFDTAYNRDLVPGLAEGVYGASYRFEVMREDVNVKAERSPHNPKGLPERTVTEVRMSEFGPVTFPAYAGSKSGIRSLTDEFAGQQDQNSTVLQPEEGEPENDVAPTEPSRAETPHPARVRRDRTLNVIDHEEPQWHL